MRAAGIACIAFVVAACSSPHPGKTATFANVCDKANEGERVTIDGYVGLLGSVMLCSDTCSLDLYPTSKVGGMGGISFSVQVGTGKSQMAELPDHYSESDVKIETSDGTVVSTGGKVRVTGEVLGAGDVPDGGSAADKATSCQLIKVDLIDHL